MFICKGFTVVEANGLSSIFLSEWQTWVDLGLEKKR